MLYDIMLYEMASLACFGFSFLFESFSLIPNAASQVLTKPGELKKLLMLQELLIYYIKLELIHLLTGVGIFICGC